MAGGAIAQYLTATIGLDVESIGRKKLEAAIALRMRAHGLRDAAAYRCLIERDAQEREHIIEEIIVPETWFFRDQGPFDLLAGLCARCELAASQARPLRVLSLPCATGEEPYSIAMTLVDAGLHPAWLAIDALDISSRSLAKARQAVFGRSSFRGTVGGWRERYFRPEAAGERLDGHIAGLVCFHQGNILGTDFPLTPSRPYRIIFCRNLLIYLTQDARLRVFQRLDSLLEPGGLLFAGHTEVLLFQQFGYELMPDRGCFACRKPQAAPVKEAPAPKPGRRPVTQAPRRRWLEPGGRPRVFQRQEPQAAATVQDLLDRVRGLADRGELDTAATQCERLLEVAGSLTAQAHCLMGEISQARNLPEAAERFFLRAVYLDPACYDALVHLSLFYEQQGSCDKALRFRQRARRLRKDIP